jgi:hypothetical protein
LPKKEPEDRENAVKAEGTERMSSEGTTLPDPREWRAQYLRMIAFPVQWHLGAEQSWWSMLTGGQPETSVRKPQKREDSGPFEDVALSLEIDPFRVQWTVTSRINTENLPEGFPTLGSVFDRRDWFVQLMERWLAQCPPIKRLAFASNLLQLVDTKDEAYRRLNRYLHGVEVDTDTSDFTYRVNRQRDSHTGIAGLRINRLCTWAAAKLSFGVRATSVSGETRNVPIQDEQNACLLDLDINTIPDFPGEALPHDSLNRIFAELVGIGLHAAEQGDRR